MYPYTSNPGAALEPVSPPSSPEPYAGYNEYMDYDVSPIDDEPDIFQRQLQSNPPPQMSPSQAPRGVEKQLTETQDQQQPPQVITGPRSGIGKTSIPTMRRERRKQRDAANAQANKDHRHSPRIGDESLPKPPPQPMGWDDPTNTDSDTQAGPPERLPKFGSTTIVTSESQNRRQASNPNSSFGQRMRQFGRGKPEPIESRPAWNGASGRQAQILPVHDDPNAGPLKIPPKSSKRAERAKTPVNLPASDLTQGASAAAAAAVRRLMPIKTAQTTDRPGAYSPAVETPKSGVPITPQAYANPAQRAGSPLQWPHDPAVSTPPTATTPSHLHVPPQFNQSIRRKPIDHPKPSAHAPQLSTSSSIYSDSPAANQSDVDTTWKRLAAGGDPFAPPPPPPRDEWSPETVPSNSDEEVELPMKNLPVVSVMERKRPIPGRNSPAGMLDNAIVISLKTATITHDEDGKEATGTDKELPPVPQELLEPQDRITFLSAKLEGLAHRRVNLTKSIKQLTELMPKDMLIVSAEVQRKREEEKRKVEAMKQELSDIQQQEYELGLKLHRAYRRQDRESDTGTLWVRRVTG